MALAAKVENYCNQNMRRFETKLIYVEGSERACVNCIWYDPYYHSSRTNLQAKLPASFGYCILRRQQRGALRQPCKDFETKEDQS